MELGIIPREELPKVKLEDWSRRRFDRTSYQQRKSHALWEKILEEEEEQEARKWFIERATPESQKFWEQTETFRNGVIKRWEEKVMLKTPPEEGD
jgi:hypothetical protein